MTDGKAVPRRYGHAVDALVPDAHALATIEHDQRAATGEFSWQDPLETWRRAVREPQMAVEADWPVLERSQ